MPDVPLKQLLRRRLALRADPSTIEDLASYFQLRKSCWIIEETEDGQFYCDCPVGFKGKNCKHELGLSYKEGRIQVLAQAEALPLGGRRPRGRPKHITMDKPKETAFSAIYGTQTLREEEELDVPNGNDEILEDVTGENLVEDSEMVQIVVDEVTIEDVVVGDVVILDIVLATPEEEREVMTTESEAIAKENTIESMLNEIVYVLEDNELLSEIVPLTNVERTEVETIPTTTEKENELEIKKPLRKDKVIKGRCGKCFGCIATDCFNCKFCKDKYEGLKKMKKACITKTCLGKGPRSPAPPKGTRKTSPKNANRKKAPKPCSSKKKRMRSPPTSAPTSAGNSPTLPPNRKARKTSPTSPSTVKVVTRRRLAGGV